MSDQRGDNGKLPAHLTHHFRTDDPPTVSINQPDSVVDLLAVEIGGDRIVLTMPMDILKIALEGIAGELGYMLRPIEHQ